MHTLWRGAVAGLAGGLAGSLVMAQVSKWTQQTAQTAAGVTGDTHEDEAHDPKVKLAEVWMGENPSPALARASKPLVHYGFGAAIGAVYGALAAKRPGIAAGWGLPFGAAVWLAADEFGLKAFHLARGNEQPTQAHAVSFATHLSFGVVTELLRGQLQGR